MNASRGNRVRVYHLPWTGRKEKLLDTVALGPWIPFLFEPGRTVYNPSRNWNSQARVIGWQWNDVLVCR